MQDHELYRRILGIEAPWQVERVELKLSQGEVHVYLAHQNQPEWACAECGALGPLYDHQPEREWRHLDTCQYRTILHAAPPRLQCPEHGVRVVKLSWAEPGSRFTALFEALAITWLKHASQKAVRGGERLGHFSGPFRATPFPLVEDLRTVLAVKGSLHGEDRSEILDKRERGGPKWTAKMAQSLTASDSLLAGMFQPRNRQSFKERGKAAAGLGPRQFHHAHPVLGALQARRRGMQNSSILTGVQMSPFPLRLMIVERAEGAAFGTSPLRLVLMGEVDMHLTL